MASSINRREVLKGLALAGAVSAVPGIVRMASAEEPKKNEDAPKEKEATPEKKIEVALVGAAHVHTPGFNDAVKRRSDVKVKYVFDHDRERAERNAKDLGAKAIDDAATVWADPDIAAVAIFSETDRHFELVKAAAKAKKAMFVEKPLCAEGKQAKEMADAIEKAGVPFTTGYFSRTIPNYLFLKEQVAKGSFGKVTRVYASNCHEAALGGWFDNEWRWMADPKIAGVGAFGDLGTHLLDILMWMFGDIESVAAEMKTITKRYGDVDETGESLMKFKNGIIGTLAAGWVDVANPVSFMISGTEGHATIFHGQLYFKSNKVADADGEKPWTKLPEWGRSPVDMFLDSALGKTGLPLVTPKEAASRVCAMEAMYLAAKEKKWVEVK
jgi:predicted dehydrogenase